MQDAINRELAARVIAAVNAVTALLPQIATSPGYVERQEVPEYQLNGHGWPSISKSRFVHSTDGPMDVMSLFTNRGTEGKPRLDASEIPELQEMIEFILADPALCVRISGTGIKPDDAAIARMFKTLDATRIVATIAERVYATGLPVETVYREHERALLADTLPVDVVVPITLTQLDIDEPLHLGDDVWVEALDEPTQRARAVDLNSSINAYLVSAATHAVVLRNREVDNSDGPLLRRIRFDNDQPFTGEIDEVFQALDIATERQLGYVQVALRPRGWAYSWLSDLPPIESTTIASRLPPALADHGWNRAPKTISAERCHCAAEVFPRLRSTNARGKLAARRLRQASLRSLPDDALLDACIGVEALLGEEHDELVHRMGLRAATALAGRMDAAFAYDVLKKVYNHRSKIVHGTEPKNSTITLKGEAWSAWAVAVLLLRSLLQSHLGEDGPWTVTDLDQRLFKSLTTLAQSEK